VEKKAGLIPDFVPDEAILGSLLGLAASPIYHFTFPKEKRNILKTLALSVLGGGGLSAFTGRPDLAHIALFSPVLFSRYMYEKEKEEKEKNKKVKTNKKSASFKEDIAKAYGHHPQIGGTLLGAGGGLLLGALASPLFYYLTPEEKRNFLRTLLTSSLGGAGIGAALGHAFYRQLYPAIIRKVFAEDYLGFPSEKVEEELKKATRQVLTMIRNKKTGETKILAGSGVSVSPRGTFLTSTDLFYPGEDWEVVDAAINENGRLLPVTETSTPRKFGRNSPITAITVPEYKGETLVPFNAELVPGKRLFKVTFPFYGRPDKSPEPDIEETLYLGPFHEETDVPYKPEWFEGQPVPGEIGGALVDPDGYLRSLIIGGVVPKEYRESPADYTGKQLGILGEPMTNIKKLLYALEHPEEVKHTYE